MSASSFWGPSRRPSPPRATSRFWSTAPPAAVHRTPGRRPGRGAPPTDAKSSELEDAQADLEAAEAELQTIVGDLPEREKEVEQAEQAVADAEKELDKRAKELKKAEKDVTRREKEVGMVEDEIAANTIAGEGIYEVGVDIQPGTYKSSGSTGCYYAVLNSANTHDIATNDNNDGPAIATVAEGQYFETTRCAEWVLQP